MSTPVPDPLVSDVARDLVQRLAPRELPLFAATSRAYFQEPGKVQRRDPGDRTLGFGSEFAEFLTPVMLNVVAMTIPFVAGIVRDALKEEGTAAAGDALRRLFRRGAADPAPPVALSREELILVREHTRKVARGLVPDEQADRIADALTASLATH